MNGARRWAWVTMIRSRTPSRAQTSLTAKMLPLPNAQYATGQLEVLANRRLIHSLPAAAFLLLGLGRTPLPAQQPPSDARPNIFLDCEGDHCDPESDSVLDTRTMGAL